jgi:hypothetical protein
VARIFYAYLKSKQQAATSRTREQLCLIRQICAVSSDKQRQKRSTHHTHNHTSHIWEAKKTAAPVTSAEILLNNLINNFDMFF